jgi:hypothetical protein
MSAALIKQNVVDVFVFALIALLLARGRVAGIRGKAAAFIAASLSVLVVALAWAATRGTSPAGLWDAVVVFRLHASGLIGSAASEATPERLAHLARAFVTSGAAAILVVTGSVLVADRHRRRERFARRTSTVDGGPFDLMWPTLGMVAWELCGVALGGSYWLHYLIATVPGLVLLVITTVRHRPECWRWTGGVLAYAAVAAVAGVVALAVGGVPEPSHDLQVERYLADHAAAGDTGVVAFGDAAMLRGAGLRSPYPLIWSLPVRVRDPRR